MKVEGCEGEVGGCGCEGGGVRLRGWEGEK